MIIDIHCHLWDQSLISAQAPPELKKLVLTPEIVLNQMNEAGIDKTAIFVADNIDFTFFKGYKESNDYIASVVKEHPDRFIGFVSIDPRRGRDAIDEVDRCADLGFKGIKLNPVQYYVNDPSFYPFYEKVSEHRLPILIHTGSSYPFSHIKYNRPFLIDQIAVDFREIPFIMAHMGKPWVDEALGVARKNPNVYVDFSAWDDYYLGRPMFLIETIAKAKNYCGIDKILFGTDFPAACGAGIGMIASGRRGRRDSEDRLHKLDQLSVKDWVDVVKNLHTPEILKQLDYPEITEEDKQLMLGGNAVKILNL
jgi:predicted TIM-barrel fold metal-dependent hydrolase